MRCSPRAGSRSPSGTSSIILLYSLAIWLTDRRSKLLYRAARAAGLAPSPAASESGRESERGRLNKSREPQTVSGFIDCYTRRSNKGLQLFYYKRGVLGAAGRREPQ